MWGVSEPWKGSAVQTETPKASLGTSSESKSRTRPSRDHDCSSIRTHGRRHRCSLLQHTNAFHSAIVAQPKFVGCYPDGSVVSGVTADAKLTESAGRSRNRFLPRFSCNRFSPPSERGSTTTNRWATHVTMEPNRYLTSVKCAAFPSPPEIAVVVAPIRYEQ